MGDGASRIPRRRKAAASAGPAFDLLVRDVLATTVALCDAAGNRERLRRTKLALDNWRGGGDERLPLGD